MKILYYSNDYGSTTTTFIRNEVNYFSKHLPVTYLCKEFSGVNPMPDFVHVLPYQPNKIVKKLKWWLWKTDVLCNFHDPVYAKKVNLFLEDLNPDIIHCHFAYEALSLLDNIDVRKYKIILHFHGYDATQMTRKKSYLRRLKALLALPNVKAISCNQFFANHLASLLKISPSYFFVLRYGVDLSMFDPKPFLAEKGEKIFLQVSSLTSKKGHEYTLGAFASLLKNNDNNNYKLLMTGDGARRKLLEELTLQLGISGQVEFLGNVSHDRARDLMNKADVFVHHSITSENGDMEGIPNALLEAMAMELPVISTWHSGIPELIEDGVNGFLVKERDVERYAKKMAAALRIGRLPANRSKIEAYYNKEKHNQQLEAYYKKILE